VSVYYEKRKIPFYVATSKGLSPLPHLHKEIEIVYVEQGSFLSHADSLSEEAVVGHLYISFPNQVHYYERPEVGKYYLVIVDTKVFFGLKDMLHEHIPVRNVVPVERETANYFELLLHSFNNGNTAAMTGYINLIMADILPKLQLQPGSGTSNKALQRLLSYCEGHYAEDITLASVSEANHLSPCYVSHLFNQKLHISFCDYINTLRVRAACEMLSSTEKNIADISGDVGYGTIRSFNRAFQRVMKTTPQNYRSTTRR